MYKHKIQILFILSIFLTVSCGYTSEADYDAENIKPEVAPAEAIEKADSLYAQRNNLNNVREALKILASARDMDNRNFVVEWKYAQMSYYLGNAIDTPEDEAEKVLEKGISAGKIAKRMEPNRPEGHFWFGAVLGEQSKRSPITVGVTSIDNIRASMHKVIEIDPKFQGASAYDVLGLLELKTLGLAGGSEEKAVEYLEKALGLEDNNSFIRLHLGEAYLANNEKAKAKEQLDYLLQMKPNERYLPEYERCVTDAKKLLKEKF